MSKDFASSKKICGTCGNEILDGQAYVAIAEDFKVGEEDAVDLFTKNYRWVARHSTTQPSRVPVVCSPKQLNSKGENDVAN